MADAANPADMSKGIAAAFGDGPEAEARKRKKNEDANAERSAVWEKMKSMGSDAAAGAKDMISDPGGVWKTLSNQ